MPVLDQGWVTKFSVFPQKIKSLIPKFCNTVNVMYHIHRWLVPVLHSGTLQRDWLTRLVSVLHSGTLQRDWLTRFWVKGLRCNQCKVCKFLFTLVRHMWQSHVEIEDYSIAYFDYIAAFKALYH